MRCLDGKVVAVTGAGMGLGRALAVEFAKRGARLALADTDPVALARTGELAAEAARAGGPGPRLTELDVADRDAVRGWADDTAARLGGVDLVVNNAGVGVVAPFEETTWEDFEWLMGTNFWGVVYGCRAFLPHLRRSREGHLVNVASVFGLVGVPAMGAYCASKYAVQGFTEALRHELRLSHANVRVTTVLPGGIGTGFARTARKSPSVAGGALAAVSARVALTSPERGAAVIVRALLRDRRRVRVGPDAVLIDLGRRILGPGVDPLTRAISGLLLPITWSRQPQPPESAHRKAAR
ncbi:SDR family oxidoreductase [Streptomyces sp. SID3343]|uniref:SDR family NAD(P)-dependent oxidoreductase n=1 Tax=Streptomyces sp. SID3343 TaxID=2690260 RepID=UPI00136A3D84|nr:SDR family oxidoreductase [Streptomyces sp. SID3343]MYV98514.1 SDR family NAD(P)-dependent oxidoreductase [Streptomyces sp. SID3343]